MECSGDALRVTLSDGRVVSVPLVWFPRLAGAREQSEWELIGGGIGIHWEAIDEDISVASLLRPENFMRLPDKPLQPTARKKRAAAGAVRQVGSAQTARHECDNAKRSAIDEEDNESPGRAGYSGS